MLAQSYYVPPWALELRVSSLPEDFLTLSSLVGRVQCDYRGPFVEGELARGLLELARRRGWEFWARPDPLEVESFSRKHHERPLFPRENCGDYGELFSCLAHFGELLVAVQIEGLSRKLSCGPPGGAARGGEFRRQMETFGQEVLGPVARGHGMEFFFIDLKEGPQGPQILYGLSPMPSPCEFWNGVFEKSFRKLGGDPQALWVAGPW